MNYFTFYYVGEIVYKPKRIFHTIQKTSLFDACRVTSCQYFVVRSTVHLGELRKYLVAVDKDKGNSERAQ